jgi:sugar lactone lactonase YvrE
MLYAAGSVRDLSVEADDLCGLTWCDRLLWFCDALRERAVALDARTGAVAHSLDCPNLRVGLATVDGHLVYAAGPELRLREVDQWTGALVAEYENPRPGEIFAGMEIGRDGLWLGYERCLELRRPDDLALLCSISVAEHVSGITVTDRFLVYSDQLDGSITIVDPVLARAVLSITVHGSPTGLSWDGSRIWYCDMEASRLRAIDVPGIVGQG